MLSINNLSYISIIYVQLYFSFILFLALTLNSFIVLSLKPLSIILDKLPLSLVKYIAPFSPTSLLKPTSSNKFKSVVANASNNYGFVPPTSCPCKYP